MLLIGRFLPPPLGHSPLHPKLPPTRAKGFYQSPFPPTRPSSKRGAHFDAQATQIGVKNGARLVSGLLFLGSFLLWYLFVDVGYGCSIFAPVRRTGKARRGKG